MDIEKTTFEVYFCWWRKGGWWEKGKEEEKEKKKDRDVDYCWVGENSNEEMGPFFCFCFSSKQC